MDFLGMGPLELLIVFLVAFLVLGPQRFIEMARTAGKFLYQLRRMGSQLTLDMMDLAEDRPATKDKVEEKREEITVEKIEEKTDKEKIAL